MLTKRRSFGVVVVCALAAFEGAALLAREDHSPSQVAPSRRFAVQGVRARFDEIGRPGSWAGPDILRSLPLRLFGVSIADLSSMESVLDQTTPIRPPLTLAALPTPPTLLKSFPGLLDNGWFPPDTQGAAGPDFLISITNGAFDPAGAFAIFDKTTGAAVQGPISLDNFWIPVCGAHGNEFVNCNIPLFDPRVEFDQSSGRFLVTSARGYDTIGGSWVHLAISNSSDPRQGFTYFTLNAMTSTPGQFADYPQMGFDSRSVTITNYMLTLTTQTQPSQWAPAKFWVIDKASLLSGGPAQVSEFLDTTLARVWQPTHSFDPAPVTYLVSTDWYRGQSKGQAPLIRALRIETSGAMPVLSVLGSILIDDFGFIDQDAPQAGCAERLDTGYPQLLNAVLRNGHIYTTHPVSSLARSDAGKTEVAWYEIDAAAVKPCSAKQKCGTPVQQGRVSDPSLWFYYPSIAVNSRGDVALGFSGSSPGAYSSAFYTARRVSDPPGTMASAVLLKSGLSPYVKKDLRDGSVRWGDYSATVVDPIDDLTFWTVQEYAEAQVAPGCPTDGTGRWGTWWGSFVVSDQ